MHDSKLVALDRDRGQCIPDRSVAGFPSAHTDNAAQRRAEDRQCDDHGERHYWNALYRHGSGQLLNQPIDGPSVDNSLGLELNYLVILMALIASLFDQRPVPRPQEQRQFE